VGGVVILRSVCPNCPPPPLFLRYSKTYCHIYVIAQSHKRHFIRKMLLFLPSLHGRSVVLPSQNDLTQRNQVKSRVKVIVE